LDFEFVTESLECLANELRPIIVDDSSGYTEAVKHVMLDELNQKFGVFTSFKGTASANLEK